MLSNNLPLISLLALFGVAGSGSVALVRGSAHSQIPTQSIDQKLKELAAARGSFPYATLGHGNYDWDKTWIPPVWAAVPMNFVTEIYFPAGISNERLTLSWGEYDYDDVPKGRYPPYGELCCMEMLPNGEAIPLWHTKVDHVSIEPRNHASPPGTLNKWLWSEGMRVPKGVSKKIQESMNRIQPYTMYQFVPTGDIAAAYYIHANGTSDLEGDDHGYPKRYLSIDQYDFFSGKPLPVLKPEAEYLIANPSAFEKDLSSANSGPAGSSSAVLLREPSHSHAQFQNFDRRFKELATARGKFPWPPQDRRGAADIWIPPLWSLNSTNWNCEIAFPAGKSNERLTICWGGPSSWVGNLTEPKVRPPGALCCMVMRDGKAIRLWHTGVDPLPKGWRLRHAAPKGTLNNWLWHADLRVPKDVSKEIQVALAKVQPYALFFTDGSEQSNTMEAHFVNPSGIELNYDSSDGSGRVYYWYGVSRFFSGKPIPVVKPEAEYLEVHPSEFEKDLSSAKSRSTIGM